MYAAEPPVGGGGSPPRSTGEGVTTTPRDSGHRPLRLGMKCLVQGNPSLQISTGRLIVTHGEVT